MAAIRKFTFNFVCFVVLARNVAHRQTTVFSAFQDFYSGIETLLTSFFILILTFCIMQFRELMLFTITKNSNNTFLFSRMFLNFYAYSFSVLVYLLTISINIVTTFFSSNLYHYIFMLSRVSNFSNHAHNFKLKEIVFEEFF